MNPSRSIVEVNILYIGGADHHSDDVLAELGYRNIYVPNISANAQEQVNEMLGLDIKQINQVSKSSHFGERFEHISTIPTAIQTRQKHVELCFLTF
ncbi:MAG: hypothetical protein PSX36_12810 [bacterium]|nr:hypothetical protein [bacterium]